ncbi:hypothetical protein LG298_09300 [Cytobacillus firmus]|uniref:hypothetical protein n=1 Tax=Cytobacillus firmus TaxID=1399 RepID=UPI00385148F6
MAKLTGNLTEEQRIIILKQRATKAHLQNKLSKINEDLAELEREKEEKNECFNSYLRADLS